METISKTSTAYQDVTHDLDQVLANGEDLRCRIAERTRTEREEYLGAAGELGVMPICLALEESLEDLEVSVEELVEQQENREDAAAVAWAVRGREALRRLQQTYVQRYEYVLDQASETGEALWNGEFDILFEPGSRYEAREAIEDAAMLFPSDWLRRSNETGAMRATVGERGEYESIPAEGYSDGVPCVPLQHARIRLQEEDLVGSAVHEWCHRFQDVVPGLARLEEAYYRRRVTLSDGTLSPPEALYGYRKEEQFRHGEFYTAFVGKDPQLSTDSRGPAFEVLPCGLEALVGGDLEEFERLVRYADHQHEAFVLGALVTL